MKLDRLKVDVEENIGENWLIAEFGQDIYDQKKYIVTTDYVHASERSETTAKEYACLFAAAPDLLEACRHFIQEAEKLMKFAFKVEKLINAIETAEGACESDQQTKEVLEKAGYQQLTKAIEREGEDK